MGCPSGDVTQMLEQVSRGDHEALEMLLPLVYDELRRLASDKMRRERVGHTLQPTALVHEAYARLLGEEEHNWESRTHFFGAAAEAMRRVLVEHARARAAAKRGGDRERHALDTVLVSFEERSSDLLALDEALTRLAGMDPQRARIVELRFFGGLTTEQIARLLDVSTRTVERGWSVARLWLRRELSNDTA